MATRAVTIAIDGDDFAHFEFLQGSLTGLDLGVGPTAHIWIYEATSTKLTAGSCNHYSFQATVEEGTGQSLINVQINCGDHASCNFTPDGLQGHHVGASQTLTLDYGRTDS